MPTPSLGQYPVYVESGKELPLIEPLVHLLYLAVELDEANPDGTVIATGEYAGQLSTKPGGEISRSFTQTLPLDQPPGPPCRLIVAVEVPNRFALAAEVVELAGSLGVPHQLF